MTFVDDHLFGDPVHFRSVFGTNEAPLAELRRRMKPYYIRTLRRVVLEYIRYTERRAITRPFSPSDEEQELYEALNRYLQREESYAFPAERRHLSILIIRKLLASSSSVIEAQAMDPEGVRREIDEVQHFVARARSIHIDEKTRALIAALAVGFAELAKMGAAAKAVVFTESRRTQEYLSAILAANGYAGQIVLFNGSNSDPASRLVYERWLAENGPKGRASGSQTIDMRTALIEHFRDHARIMIATEAGAEGVNLQFCSLVINYDLAWNPQRIEQRIGRCHRYGQKFDVVVVNFLNTRNEADRRVLELLDEKFQLFRGVFGASDEVLGTIESGIDFERRIFEIYQGCRTPAEIEAAFERLQNELDQKISTRLQETRKVLLEQFDEEVHRRKGALRAGGLQLRPPRFAARRVRHSRSQVAPLPRPPSPLRPDRA